MAGFIKIPRDIQDSWVWDNPRRYWMWSKLLFMAAYEDGTTYVGNTKIHYRPGQIVSTFTNLMNKLRISNRALHNFLDILQENGTIAVRMTPKYTVITILDDIKIVNKDEVKSQRKSKSPHQNSNPIKELEEEKNKDEINNSTLTAREKLFIDEVKNSDSFFEQTAESLSCNIDVLKSYFNDFANEMIITQKTHSDSADFRRHFFNWVKIILERNGRTRQKAGGVDKYEARRGTGVSAKTADDFQESF